MTRSRHDNLKIRIATIKKGDRGHSENKRLSWARLRELLSSPIEDKKYTLQQYLDLPVDKQNKLKDVGSFVGGPFRDNLRRGDALLERSIVTLDVDQATAQQIDFLKMGLSSACKYEFFGSTTRKHTKKKPRWRFVFPMTRPVTIEEYAPLSRILASTLFASVRESMDAVDDVSYRHAQVMYWPSVCKEALFESLHNSGRLLDPDKVLDAFGDWQDWTKLPYSEKRGKKRPTAGQKAEDPRQKSGSIGAFCRAYSVEDAIATFLPDIYAEGDEHSAKPRYTYLLGSSSNGAVVEDDGLFLYSHHGTDPCAERLVNAFDLVRIHKFGDLDYEQPEDALPTELPSFKAMIDFIKDDPNVRAEIDPANDYDYAPDLDFDNLDEDEPDQDEDEPVKPKKKKKAPVQDDDEDEEEDDEEEDESGPDRHLLRQSRFPAPEFPLDVLGRFWSQRVKLWSDNSAAPIDYAAMAALTGAASTIGNARWVQAKEGWKEPPVLWCALVGPPSSNKSPAMNPLASILADLEQSWMPIHADAMREWETEKRRSSIIRAQWEQQAREAIAKGKDMEDIPVDAMEPQKPIRRRAFIGDATLESLIATHAANPRGLLHMRDEMSGWFANLSRYSNGSDRPAWLEAYGGRPYIVDRVKHDGKPLYVRRFSVSNLGGLQPDRLLDLLTSADDGLQARFIYSWPESKPRKLTDGLPEDNAALEAFRKLSELEMDVDNDGVERPVVVPLSKKAWARFKDWAYEHALQERSAAPALQNAYGKANGLVLRLACVLEHLWWSCDMFDIEPPPHRISLRAINAAIRLREEYIKPMQIRVFRHVGKSESERDAHVLAGWILETMPTKITMRDLTHGANPVPISDPRRISAALEYLVVSNWLSRADARSKAKGGRPTNVYVVNKEVYRLLKG